MNQEAPMSLSAHVAAIDMELTKILSMLSTARRLMDENRVVDLSALEMRTRFLCARVLDLPQLDARKFTAQLEGLLNQLDSLAADMHAKFGDLPVLPSRSAATAAGAYTDVLKHFP
jgi:hypothetical protein